MRSALLAAALSLIASVLLCGAKPLWLDEILQLNETLEPSAAEMLSQLPRNPGAAPLGYLVQHETLRVTGYSAFWARVPAAVFGAGAVFVVALLGTELGLTYGWLAAAILACFPLTLRYAAESRIYSQALFLSAAATLIYVRLSTRPTWRLYGLYTLVLAAAAYTQPYAASVGFAHVIWSCTNRQRKLAWMGLAGCATTFFAFLPWYLCSKGRWAAGLGPNALHFSASIKTPLMLFRELAGAGYWGSGLLLILCIWAIKDGVLDRSAKTLLVVLIALTLTLVFAADAFFNYFLATRQFIWALPSVALLAAAALERRTRIATVLGSLLFAVCLWQNVRYFTAPRENWQAAADFMLEQVHSGACLVMVPQDQAFLYEFFQPSLRRTRCPASRLILVITPYATPQQQRTALAALQAQGYAKEWEVVVGKSTMIRLHRQFQPDEEHRVRVIKCCRNSHAREAR